MSAPDALATSMLVIFGIAFGVLLTLLFHLAQNAGKKDELEELFQDESLTSPEKTRKKPPSSERQAWEQDPDWWKEKNIDR